jgi:hypothetical protein
MDDHVLAELGPEERNDCSRREAPNSTRPKPQNDTPSVDVSIARSRSQSNSSDAIEVPPFAAMQVKKAKFFIIT